MNILIDTLGSDKGFEEIVQGTINAMKNEMFDVTFIGPEEKIKPLIDHDLSDRISYIDTEVFITNDESPTMALRKKKDASMAKGFQVLNEKEYDGLLSCGSTGALLTGATLITKRIKGIDRPALMIVLPTQKGQIVFMDAGANTDISEKILLQFAQMGAVYASKVLDIKEPKVGLLNIGQESKKGDELRQKAYELLSKEDFFKGNVEARDVLNGDFDVVVTDGFSGNVFLKTMEGIAGLVTYLIKGQLKDLDQETIQKLQPMMKNLQGTFDYREYGSAPFLGIRKPVFKAHGASDQRAIETGIYTLLKYINNNVIDEIEDII